MQYIKKSYIDPKVKQPFKAKYNLIDLSRMLTYPRPAWSKMEDKYIHKFIDTVPGIQKDTYGNRFITIGKKPETMFASHTDTVHREPNYYTREWYWNSKTRRMEKGSLKETKRDDTLRNIGIKNKWAYSRNSDILGADDTTGNWLMLNMIDYKKPGMYIFHRAEETGREGSRWIAEHQPKRLKGIKRVISFDRKGYKDIITHQAGERTASDTFAKELARRLGGEYRPDPTGSFTDSKSYSHLVPECTNISIGYKDAHTRDEMQNLRFARYLYNQIIDVDFETLPTERKPSRQRSSWMYPQVDAWDYDYNYYGYNDLTKKKTPYQKRLDKAMQRLERKKVISKKESDKFLLTDDDYDNWLYKQMKKKKDEGVLE